MKSLCLGYVSDPDSYSFQGSFYQHGLTIIKTWVSNYINYKDKIIDQFPNFNNATIEAW